MTVGSAPASVWLMRLLSAALILGFIVGTVFGDQLQLLWPCYRGYEVWSLLKPASNAVLTISNYMYTDRTG